MARILLVDDDTTLRHGIARALLRAGHAVREADTGREALEMLDREKPALVVTDINMPEMDGIEFVLALRDRDPSLPVIAISGGGLIPKEILLANADSLGATTTISKPFPMTALVSLVDEFLGLGGSRPTGSPSQRSPRTTRDPD